MFPWKVFDVTTLAPRQYVMKSLFPRLGFRAVHAHVDIYESCTERLHRLVIDAILVKNYQTIYDKETPTVRAFLFQQNSTTSSRERF